MEQEKDLKKIKITWRTAFAVALVLFILFGLGTKLILSINMSLNSDMVGEGLEAMDIWKHQNYFLSGYYLPSQDTFLFTELLPFQLIPQILTDYDPAALKLMTYIEFALGAGVLAYIVFMITGEALNALLFTALAVNVPPIAYQFFSLPTSHAGTVVFLGIILALLIYVNKKEGEKKQKTKKGRKVRDTSIQWPYVIALIVLTALTVVSDTIILPWLILPLILAYLLVVKEKSRTMNIVVALMAAVSAIVYIYKTYFVYTWVVQDVVTGKGTSNIFSTILPLYFKALALTLNEGLYSVFNGFAGFGILEALSLAAFAALAIYSAWNILHNGQNRFFNGILLASVVIMFAMFLVSNYSIDISSARYLTFTAFAVLMLIAASCRKDDKICGALALSLLLISAIYGYSSVSGTAASPNAQEYGLIDYMKQNNLTFGYSSYWYSNILTYLSGEDITVRATFFYRDDMKPNVWLANERWYQSTPDRSFILVDNSSIGDNGREVISALTTKLNASEALHYEKYDIYPLEGYHIGPFQVVRD
ncbi:MAG TPA: hypothetical protein VMC84_03115 [Methanocella sp.]|uniref:hypothetical protein n=1 Tax=Methanocella sp. TaxID=2052833 RepID=UPI002CAF7572|nr:hypothetical protein [Methanocella sp.]HTY90143.1 hypothetical protein [Methanocella sp.]